MHPITEALIVLAILVACILISSSVLVKVDVTVRDAQNGQVYGTYHSGVELK